MCAHGHQQLAQLPGSILSRPGSTKTVRPQAIGWAQGSEGRPQGRGGEEEGPAGRAPWAGFAGAGGSCGKPGRERVLRKWKHDNSGILRQATW